MRIHQLLRCFGTTASKTSVIQGTVPPRCVSGCIRILSRQQNRHSSKGGPISCPAATSIRRDFPNRTFYTTVTRARDKEGTESIEGDPLARGDPNWEDNDPQIAEGFNGIGQTYDVYRHELIHLVDNYAPSDHGPKAAHEPEPDERNIPSPSVIEAEKALIADGEDVASEDELLLPSVSALKRELDKDDAECLSDREHHHKELVRLYHLIPNPRPFRLSRSTMHKLLDHLSVVKYKSEESMRRYFTVFDDVKSIKDFLERHHWNSAIAFAGRYSKEVTERRLHNALNLWRDMEGEAGIMANYVTFNILYDIATKAKKYVLADMIVDEMKTRNQDFSRFFLTNNIISCGIRGDGGAVRKAYKDLIDAEEVIDTSVMNCVINALLRCGEATAAEMTFERIKQLHASKTDRTLPLHDWREKRILDRQLSKRGVERRQARANLDGPFSPNPGQTLFNASTSEDEEGATIAASEPAEPALINKNTQEESMQTSIAPDLYTFKLLIRYNAIIAGDIERVATLVDEMEQYSVSLHGHIFIHLFKAFDAHGGVLYTQWTIQRLENTLTSLLKAVDAEEGPAKIYISAAMCVVAIRAYLKCCGAGRCAEVWLDMRARLPETLLAQSDDIEKEIRSTMAQHDAFFMEILQRREPHRVRVPTWSQAKQAMNQRNEAAEELDDMSKKGGL